ncbi:MAG: hypothetical protein HY318_00935, partial [Armatimonadetes bacterium]|nr:hypothetical protein [Armatimonadota bacterium]
MKILVVNCGSSSLKYQLFEMTCPSDSLDEKQTGSSHEKILARGIVERIGERVSGSGDGHRAGMILCQNEGQPEVSRSFRVPDHSVAMDWVISSLTDPQTGVLNDAKEITAVGHRVVHGGERFSQSVVIDDSVLAAIRECSQLAPLHNPPNLIGIESCQRLLLNAPQVAVFDTAFFATLPRHAYLYALPLDYYE